jgi:hypothetical protein
MMKKLLLVFILTATSCTYDQPVYNGNYYANNNNSNTGPVARYPTTTTIVNTYAPYWSYPYYQGYYGGYGYGGWGYGYGGWGGYRWGGWGGCYGW